MNKRPFAKREIVLITVAAVSLLLTISAVIYIGILKGDMAAVSRSNGATLRMKENELNEQTTYIDTICGEYRKLYYAYKDLSEQSSSGNSSQYTIPGSAKGDVDECYQ